MRWQVELSGSWKDVSAEDAAQLEEHRRRGEKTFQIKSRGQTYGISLNGRQWLQTNAATGKGRPIRLVPEGTGPAAGEAPPPKVVAVPAPPKDAPGTVRMCCGGCAAVSDVAVPRGAAPGTPITARCPRCGTENQFQSPGATPGSYRPGLAPGKPEFRPPPRKGKQRALLIGVNYFGTRAQLRGCINDVHNMRRLLTQTFGWRQASIRTLTDDAPSAMPTRRNIELSLHWLVEGVRPGDVLFLHFSGHGAQKEDPQGMEEDGMNETVLPVDFQEAGMITDDEIAHILVHHLPEGVRMTVVMDCCHSGTGLDLPFTWTRRGWREEVNPYHSAGDVQLFSGCEDDGTSADASSRYGAAEGAMTSALCDALRQNPCPTYPELLARLHQAMDHRGFCQRPQLTSTQAFSFDRPFLLDDIVPNSNPNLGRTFRQRFMPRPRPMGGPLGDMLGIGMAVLGGMMLGEVLGGLLAF